jgi:hypothetical protein
MSDARNPPASPSPVQDDLRFIVRVVCLASLTVAMVAAALLWD